MLFPKLLSPAMLGHIPLSNRVVMAPMTRCRAIDNLANDLMATYYGQRASAGLIIVEGTGTSPNGTGYARQPALYTETHAEAFKKVTSAVHGKGGKIVVQLMHTGRASHPLNMSPGSEILAPSAIAIGGKMWTDQQGLQDFVVPRAMTKKDIQSAIDEYVKSAELGMKAGFDCVELHGANGYLIEEFLNPKSNQRTDEYGGSSKNRMRFALEAAKAVTSALPSGTVGMRISPRNAFGDIEPNFDGVDEFYEQLATELNSMGLAYLHVMVNPDTANVVSLIRKSFKGPMILCGGYTAEKAEADLNSGIADLVAFARPFLANPDVPKNFRESIPLVEADHNTFYTPGPEGYTTYK